MIAGVAILLAAAVPVSRHLNEVRRASGMQEVDVTKLPTLGAASLFLMGGFRGVAVDVLWIEAMELHQSRRYAEERALIELIGDLQPNYISVWIFQAWNVSYNISVQYNDPREQWKWVKDGIAYLNKGLKLNPGNGDLLFYMGWLYYDKVHQNPYFEEALDREEHLNNFEEAAKYFEEARKIGGVTVFGQWVVESCPSHAYLARAGQILARSELADNLTFPPKTLAKAEVFTRKSREEADALIARWPKDTVAITFPARADLVLSDGYVDQIPKILQGDDFSDAAFDKAEKVLDKALAELAKYRAGCTDPHVVWVFDNKVASAWVKTPVTVLTHVDALMRRPTTGVAELRRALRMLDRAQEDVRRVPEDVRRIPVASRDVDRLREVLPKYREGLLELIREREAPPMKPGPEMNPPQ
jgi:tetratricopeptide (TPR) repeat protein